MAKKTGKKTTTSSKNAHPGSKASASSASNAKIPTGGDKVVQCLEREGVDVVFGLPGGAAIPLFDALYESRIKLVLTRHEQGATHMADG
jgi:Thiamine pyrophosphate enzyme, N-terminal TPP binding domain